MGSETMPASFGYPFFIRVFLPGMLAAGFMVYIIVPAFVALGINLTFFDKLLSIPFFEKLGVVAILGTLIGQAIQSLDLYIYQILEGIWLWPSCIQTYFQRFALIRYNNILVSFNEKERILDRTEDEKTYLKLKRDLYFLTIKLRQYPVNKSCIEATDLGNIITEYEMYPYEQYGMDYSVYWSRIWSILPELAKTDLEARSARADFCVYITFISLLSWPFIVLRAYQLWGVIISIAALVGWWQISKKFLYKMSLSTHCILGEYIKATFDVHRVSLAKQLHLPISLTPTDEEKELWMEYKEFLIGYSPTSSQVFKEKMTVG